MQRKESLIKGALKLLQAILVSLLAMSILGCSTVKPPTDPRNLIVENPCPDVDVEIWRIDPNKLELYRRVNKDDEEILKIQGSKLMHQFIALDVEEYGKLVEALFEQCRGGQ